MKKVSEKIRILTITPGLNVCGGIESYVMNYYIHMKEKVKMDFITHDIKDEYYSEIISKNGDNIYLMKKLNLKNFKKVKEDIEHFFEKHHDYDIVYCHMANAAFLYLKYAKEYGIKVRILHSHQNKAADTITHSIRNIPLIAIGKRYATHNFACSKIAGDFLFNKKKYYIIKNAIDTNKYKYDESIRKIVRKELGITKELLIGNIGRFCNQKNQLFLIDVFKIIHKKMDSKLLLIGDGVLKESIQKEIKKNNLENDTIIIPPTEKVNNYYQAMDVFVLPSLYEGLGIVNIEAQVSGLKTIVSTGVPKDAKISDLIEFISLDESKEKWADEIINNSKYQRSDHQKDAINNGFDINAESKKLYNILKSIVDESGEI